MAITLPRMSWGWAVTASTKDLPFDRGGDKDADLNEGDYTPTEFATEVARAMNAADAGQAYTCVYDISAMTFTLDNGATAFALEFSRDAATNCAGLLGFADSDTASSAAGHTGSATGAGSSTAFTWAPTDPVATTTPVTAATDGTTATLLQRRVRAAQNIADGGKVETLYFSTDKLITLHFKWLSASGSPSEQTNMESFLDWIERGRRFLYQPDATSVNALRLCLLDPGDLANSFSRPTLSDVDYPPLNFIQQLTR